MSSTKTTDIKVTVYNVNATLDVPATLTITASGRVVSWNLAHN